jgi:hypothetical protein
VSAQYPIRRDISSHASTCLSTDSRQRALNSATPYASMSRLPVRPSSFSTATSTGSPWQSQPPLRGTWNPCMVLNRGNRSLKVRASTWCAPGIPLAVGGPS